MTSDVTPSGMTPSGMTPSAAKAEWRSRLLAARRERSAAERTAAQRAVTTHLLAALESLGSGRPLTVCLYLPLPSEPLAPDAPFLVARRGHRVLVPVTTVGEPLDWCELPAAGDGAGITAYDAALVPGPLGVPEPTGPRLGPAALLTADVAVVPALATDPAGFRLGRGGGFYDRSLALLSERPLPSGSAPNAGTAEDDVIPDGSPGIPRIAVLFDGEADLPVPHESHDARVSHVLTPAAGLRRIS